MSHTECNYRGNLLLNRFYGRQSSQLLVIILEPNPRHVIHHLSFISITDKSQ